MKSSSCLRNLGWYLGLAELACTCRSLRRGGERERDLRLRPRDRDLDLDLRRLRGGDRDLERERLCELVADLA